MNERFDDIIRRQLENLESAVPDDLFDRLKDQPGVQDAGFDDGIRHKLNPLQSPVPANLFDAIAGKADLQNLSFDSEIRAKLEAAATPVPAGMWERIVQEKNRRRRPVAFWWIAASTIFLILGGTGYHFFQTADSNKHVNSLENNRVVSGSYSTDQPSTKAQQQSTTIVIDHPGKPDIAFLEKSSASNDEKNQNDPVNGSILPGKRNTPSSQERSDFTAENGYGNGYYLEANRFSKKTHPSKTFGSNGDENGLYNLLDENGTIAELNTNNLLRAATAFTGKLSKIQRQQPGQLLQAKPLKPVIPCPILGNEASPNWYMDAYASALLLNKRVEDNIGEKNAKNGFDSTLHQQLSYNAGISLVKEFGNNILLKTGLQYNRINEAFRVTRINERRLVTSISIRTVILSPGDTVIIRDTSVTEHIGTAIYRRQNTYTQWDIPLIVGYAFGGENMQINANAGIIANIRSSYKGEIISDTSQTVKDINNVNGGPVYRRQTGLSLYAGFTLLKPLSSKISIWAEPHIRYGLGHTATSNAWFTQKNTLWGVSLGIRYKINKGRQRL